MSENYLTVPYISSGHSHARSGAAKPHAEIAIVRVYTVAGCDSPARGAGYWGAARTGGGLDVFCVSIFVTVDKIGDGAVLPHVPTEKINLAELKRSRKICTSSLKTYFFSVRAAAVLSEVFRFSGNDNAIAFGFLVGLQDAVVLGEAARFR